MDLETATSHQDFLKKTIPYVLSLLLLTACEPLQARAEEQKAVKNQERANTLNCMNKYPDSNEELIQCINSLATSVTTETPIKPELNTGSILEIYQVIVNDQQISDICLNEISQETKDKTTHIAILKKNSLNYYSLLFYSNNQIFTENINLELNTDDQVIFHNIEQEKKLRKALAQASYAVQ